MLSANDLHFAPRITTLDANISLSSARCQTSPHRQGLQHGHIAVQTKHAGTLDFAVNIKMRCPFHVNYIVAAQLDVGLQFGIADHTNDVDIGLGGDATLTMDQDYAVARVGAEAACQCQEIEHATLAIHRIAPGTIDLTYN